MNTRHRKFVDGLIDGKSGAQAARDAGYAPNSARQTANELLTNPDIQKRIQARLRDANVRPKEVLGTLVSQMRGDIADVLPESDILQRAQEKGISHLIRKVKVKQKLIPNGEGEPIVETDTEIEMYSSQKAAEVLSGLLGLIKEPAKNPYDSAKDAVKALLTKFPTLEPERAKIIVSETFGIEVDQISDASS